MDVNLALVRMLQRRRPELRIVLMSATLGGDVVRDHIPEARVFMSAGRVFPVDIRYTAPCSSALHEQVSDALQPAIRKDSGDVLLFLPGAAANPFCDRNLYRTVPPIRC